MEINKDTRQKAVDYSINTIKHICTNLPPRESGSMGERMAQEYLGKDINDNKWADKTVFEEFEVASKAFMGFSKIIPIFLLIGLIFFAFKVVWAPLAMAVISLVIFLSEFGLYKQFLDPFYKKTLSSNLIAIKKPKGEVKKRIIFSGHSGIIQCCSLFKLLLVIYTFYFLFQYT